jgi:hypothetical protein
MPLNSPAEHIPGFEYRATVAQHRSVARRRPDRHLGHIAQQNGSSAASEQNNVAQVRGIFRPAGAPHGVLFVVVLDKTAAEILIVFFYSLGQIVKGQSILSK